MSEIKVFISYSHDSEAHREKVLALSERLRADGIKTILDQYVNGSPEQGWPRWMLDQLDAATFVLVICTETYYRRFRGHEEPGKGKGVDWEGALITQELYDARSRTLKFVPVFLSDAVADWIPEPLRSIGYYALTSASAYEGLYDFLTGQAGVAPRPVGTLKTKPRKIGGPLTFDEPAQPARPIDISRIIKYAPTELIGREAETALLNDAWAKAQSHATQRPHILTFVALGGEGKTSLVAKWAAELAAQDWPGCEAVFAWSFYSQGTREQTAVSSDLFLSEALTFFGDAALAGSAAGAFEKGQQLARLMGERRALLILDGLEPLQYAPTAPTAGELKDQGLAALLKGLAANSHGLCVVTTRYAVPDLRAYWQNNAPQCELPRLATAAGVKLLRNIGVQGTLAEFEQLVEDMKGHALTLQIMGQFLVRAFHGDIRRRDRVNFEKADAKIQGGHAFRAMEAYVKWLEDDSAEARREVAVLKLLGLFDRPATAELIDVLRRAPAIPGLTEPLVGLAEEDWEYSLTALRDARLLTVNRDAAGTLLALDAHPLVREYFAKRLKDEGGRMKEGEPSSLIPHPSSFQLAHRRLYKHLCATTKEGDQPTLEDLQPLYQAVAHGCQAGLQQEAYDKVYFARIRKGNEYYSVHKLGAFGSDLGAIACFFCPPWSIPDSGLKDSIRAVVLGQAAFYLRALGRLTESLEPMRASSEQVAKREDWKNAAIGFSNLSELELTLGEVAGAVGDAEQSVTYADRSGNAGWKEWLRTTLANTLNEAGRHSDALLRFREAEDLQKDVFSNFAYLFGEPGFSYCGLLLVEAERGAWQSQLSGIGDSTAVDLIRACREAEKRALVVLDFDKKRQGTSLVEIALDHLTLGRAALYAAILEPSAIRNSQSAIESAVSGLRRAGAQEFIPRALLTRAWLRHLTGMRTGPESAESDLDEAWEIAARGSMKLFLADIHLYRARLFGMRKAEGGVRNEAEPYPWESPQHDLAEAARLINACGYHRRDGELADAKRALGG